MRGWTTSSPFGVMARDDLAERRSPPRGQRTHPAPNGTLERTDSVWMNVRNGVNPPASSKTASKPASISRVALLPPRGSFGRLLRRDGERCLRLDLRRGGKDQRDGVGVFDDERTAVVTDASSLRHRLQRRREADAGLALLGLPGDFGSASACPSMTIRSRPPARETALISRARVAVKPILPGPVFVSRTTIA